MILTKKSALSNLSVLGRAGAALGMLILAASSVRATVIVQDTFEPTSGNACSESAFWRYDSRSSHYCIGGGGNCGTYPAGNGCGCFSNADCISGNCYDDVTTSPRGPVVGIARNGINPPTIDPATGNSLGSNSCFAYYHYIQTEQNCGLNSSDEASQNYSWPGGTPDPTRRKVCSGGTNVNRSCATDTDCPSATCITSSSPWPAGTKGSATFHYVYYIYIDSQHSNMPESPGASFWHPIGQKLGKWLFSSTFSGAQSTCSANCMDMELAMMWAQSGAGGSDLQNMRSDSFVEGSPGVAEPPYYNQNFNCDGSVPGCTPQMIGWNGWHKIELYMNLRHTCTGGPTSNAGCSDQLRVWVDGVLGTATDTGNLAGGSTLANPYNLNKFWFFGNDSCGGTNCGTPVNYWILADNFCVGTSFSDCTGAPFYGTKAQAAFGGGTSDTTPPATTSNLAASGATSNSVNLTWTAPGDDGSTGTATSYDVRYRTDAPLTASNWATATQASNEPSPKPAGQAESFTIAGLFANTTYYFGLKTSDEVPNTSGVSNSPSATTTAASAAVTYLSDGFESGNLNSWTDDDGGFGGMAVTTSGPHTGTYANHQRFATGDGGTYGAVFFADHPLLVAPDPQWTGVQETDVTLQWAAKFSAGFDGATGTKMFEMNSFVSWSANYPGPNTWAAYYTLLMIDSGGHPFMDLHRKVGTDGWMEMDQNQGAPVSITDGAWHVLKTHLKLNTPGLADGVGQLWIDGILKADFSNVNFRDSYTATGWNHLVLSSNIAAGAPKAEDEYWDDILLTGGSLSSNTGPPGTPQNLIRTDKH
jgi:fibronectin type III domain protein